jgi:hypothetical protein
MTPDEFDNLIDSIEGDTYRMATFHDNTFKAPIREMKKQAKTEYRKLQTLVDEYKKSCEAFKAKQKVAAQELQNLREARR